MILRDLGKTGLKVGEIGLGTEHLKRASKETVMSVVGKAIENGINYFDLLFNFSVYLENFGAAFQDRRDRVILTSHLGSADRNGRYFKTRSINKCESTFLNALSTLGTDYIDIINVHYVKDMKEFEEISSDHGVLELAHRLRDEGKARLVGISTHDVSVVKKAAESGRFDVVTFQVNMANNALLGRNEALAACARESVGLVAMKPFAGGYLLRQSKTVGIAPIRKGGGERVKLKIPSSMTPIHCLAYVLSQIGVSTTIPGVRSIEELDGILSYVGSTAEEKDFSEILNNFKEYETGQCVYCNHCLPCPSNIDIGEVTRLLDIAKFRLTEEMKAKYTTLQSKASECIKCGVCVDRCPFEVDIVSNMEKAANLLEQ
ncbi:MAG: aldo/keto reductase [Candidatus Bathyarchaeota archaeon]|nr:aldo/keto reductase [Candidatus Bathyarchaeota archaeon]